MGKEPLPDAVPPARRLLWNPPAVIGIVAVALLVTTAIFALQIAERRGVYDPETITIFYRLFLFQDYRLATGYLFVLLLALFPQVQQAGRWLVAGLTGRPLVVAAVAFLALAAASRWVYTGEPLAMDEYGPFMQSEIFASGALFGAIPPDLVDWLVFPSFQDYFIKVDRQTGAMASVYWPGFAILLTPFKAIGLPWLCNPLLGGLALLAIHRLVIVLTASPVAAAAAIAFSLASPAFVINAISFYSMTAHLLLNVVFVLLLSRPTPARAFVAGLVGGLSLTLHNPVPHVLFALPWLIWLVLRSDRWRMLPAIGAGYLPGVVVIGFGWSWLLGSHSGPASAGGTPQVQGLLASALESLTAVLHWPTEALLDARMIGLAKLWLWAAPALLVVAALGFWRHRDDVRVRLMATSAALTFVGYLFVPFDQGHGWGFRYMHSVWFVFPVLAALCLVGPQSKGSVAVSQGASPISGYPAGAALGGLLILIPLTAWQVNAFIRAHVAQLPTADHGVPKVVIVNPYGAYYAQDLVQNDPFLRGPVVRMVTRGRAEDARMMARHYPDLVLLKSGYRGTVWGYADGNGEQPTSTRGGPLVDHKGKEERTEGDVKP